VPDPVVQAGTVKGVKAQQKKVRDREIEDADVVKALLSTPAGRRWYARLLHDVCGIYQPVNARFATEGVHFQQGARAVGLFYHKHALQVAPDQYMVLLSENLV
jgi:hypothetical protein